MTYNNDSNSSLTSLIMQGIMNALADTHTIIIGQIEKVNKTTIDVQPVIARNVNGKEEPLPVFPDVPFVNFLGGTSSIQMPLAKGDDCILFVSERCLMVGTMEIKTKSQCTQECLIIVIVLLL